jgi:signal transduction histidine kinase
MAKHNIFIKIYLGFWLATTLVVAAQMTLDRWMELRPLPRFIERNIGPALALYGETILECKSAGGPHNAAAFEDEFTRSTGVRTYITSPEDGEIHSRTLPPDADPLAQRAMKSGRNELSLSPERIVMAVPIRSVDGTPYCVIGETFQQEMQPPPPMGPHPALRIFLFLVVSGGVCYGLARYLTAPIIKIREATRRFAAGDLHIRIGKEMGSRRDELADLGSDFDRMAERIQSLVTLQWQLLGDISHELRSPLTRLRVAVELLQQPRRFDPGLIAERIEKEIDRLNEMIGQVLTLTRLEIGRDGVRMSPVDLAQLVEEVAADGDFEARGHNRGVQLAENTPCTVMGNEVLLRRAVENVLRNAIRYTAEHSVVEMRMLVSPGSARDTVEIRVRDHGPGVPAKEQENLFRPFYRVSHARERQSGGTGLGLAITERSVRLHRGTVNAQNAPDGGLVVTITLSCLPDE